jgi:hypothetical protein
MTLQTEMPNIREVRAGEGRTVVVLWKGGIESVIDLTEYLAAYAVFAPLREDGGLFGTAVVGDWGWCVRWTDDMEVSADTLWRLALEQGSGWLRAWRARHRMTQGEAARALGVSPRMWRYYEAGSHLLPKTVRLAGAGFDVQPRAA